MLSAEAAVGARGEPGLHIPNSGPIQEPSPADKGLSGRGRPVQEGWRPRGFPHRLAPLSGRQPARNDGGACPGTRPIPPDPLLAR